MEGVAVHVKNFSLLSAFLCEILFSGEPNEHDPKGFKPEASWTAELRVSKNFPDTDGASLVQYPFSAHTGPLRIHKGKVNKEPV